MSSVHRALIKQTKDCLVYLKKNLHILTYLPHTHTHTYTLRGGTEFGENARALYAYTHVYSARVCVCDYV